MQTRNGSRKHNHRNSMRHKHARRILDLEGADNEFHSELEANTNFTMNRRRPKTRAGTGQHAPTILSQVKKYGIEDHGIRYVRTQEGVTDDPDNYLARRTNLNYSYIEHAHDPKQKVSKNRTSNIKQSQKLSGKVQEKDFASKSKTRQTAHVMTIGGGELASARDCQSKPLFNIGQNSNQVQSRNNMKGTTIVNVDNAGASDGGQSGMTQPHTEVKHRLSLPLSIASQKQKNTIDVARQIEEKAGASGSAGFLLNEDSENSEHMPSEFERNKLPLNETIKALDSEERLMVQEPYVRSQDGMKLVQSNSNFGNTHVSSIEESKFPKRVVSTSGPDFERIQDLVERENKRLWRLYDNRLKDGMTFDQKQKQAQHKASKNKHRHSQVTNKHKTMDGQQHYSEQMQHEDSERVVTQQFLDAVKNHTVYRRDNFISKLANQTKQSFDPYLRFQQKSRGDPFAQRPLSSAVYRVGGMYPSREACSRQNATDAVIQRQANKTFNMNRDNLRPGTRPFSSNLNQLVLLKDDSNQFSTQPTAAGHYRKSMDHLGKGRSRGFVQISESHQAPSRTTATAGQVHIPNVMSSSAIDAPVEAQRHNLQTQHQRMLSYQMSVVNTAPRVVQGRQKHRPVSSVPYPGGNKAIHLLNGRQRVSEKDEIEMSSDPADFVNVRQMFDPSIGDSLPKSLTGDRPTQFIASETDIQSFQGTNQAKQEDIDQQLLDNDASKEAFTSAGHETRQAPFSQMNTRKNNGSSKTSQDLVTQLRIKSVRQSKVQIIEDKLRSGHFDIIVDSPEDIGDKNMRQQSRGLRTQQVTTRPLLPKDKVISNATNLHRPADTGVQAQRGLQSSDAIRSGEMDTNDQSFNFIEGASGHNEFPDAQCVQLSIEVLQMYPIISHMKDFLVFSETRSPIFVYDPPKSCSPTRITLILQRFKECIELGELEQAMGLLDLGIKQNQFLPIFKFNVGMTYLLSQQYLEAIQTFRLLSKSYPMSTAVNSNLLFAYLCDGWVNNVKEFQSTALFQSIRAPLSDQTKSILELIKYAFTSADLLMLGTTQGSQRPKSAPKVSSHEDYQTAKDPFNIKPSDVMELASEEDDEESMETPMTEEDLIEFVNFKWYPKIKNYTRREQLLVPINHLLRKKLRQARLTGGAPQQVHDNRAKSVSPLRRDLPNYWNHYQKMLKVYHRKDRKKHQEVRKHFEHVLERIHKLCNDEETFQRGITTKIQKRKQPVQYTGQSSSKIRNSQHRSQSIGSHLSSAEKARGDGDVNTLLRKVKKVEEKKVKELTVDDGVSLDAIFKQLVNQRSTYISDAVADPIENSYFELIEGLSIFHEKYNVRTFIDEYLALQDDIRKSEQMQKMMEAQGETIHEHIPSKREWNDKFVEKFPVSEEHTMRARQFLLDVLFGKLECDILSLKPMIERMAHSHIDRKNQAAMDTERFETEQTFMTILRMLLELQQDLIRRLRHPETTQEMKDVLETQHFLNQWYIKKLHKRKGLNGQPEEQRLIQTLKMSKADHAGHAELEIEVQSPLNHEKLDPAPISAEKEKNYQDLYTQGWEKFTYRALPKEERLRIAKKVSDQADLVLKKARVNAQQRIIDRLQAVKNKDQALMDSIAEHQVKLDDYKKEIMADLLREKQELQDSEDKGGVPSLRNIGSPRKSPRKKQGKQEKPKNPRDELIDEFELQTIKLKLNLDAIDITTELPKSHVEQIGLWEETAALKVIQKKIEQINETLRDPEVLFAKDEQKLKPQMEKWYSATGENHGNSMKKQSRQHIEQQIDNVAQKDLQDLSNTLHEMKDALKDTIGREGNHLRVRPSIGNEVNDDTIALIEKSVINWTEITAEEQKSLDALISSKNRFFSIFDEDTRLAMYEHCKVHRYNGAERVIVRDVEEDAYDDEEDVKEKDDDDENTRRWKREERERRIEAQEADETQRIHILLRGNIHIVQINEELDIQLRLASLRAGEVCGDQSIQRKIRDPLKVLSKERKTAVTNSAETITISIGKTKFMAAVFKEMQLELFYKIILLRNTSFFEELSPYSLTIIASNVEVREVKYGEIIVQQGQNPDAMYILAYGQCKTVYQYVDEKSTKVSKYANKCLKSDLPAPIHTGPLNYHKMPFGQRRKQSGEDDQSAFLDKAEKQVDASGYEKPKVLSKGIQDKLARQGKMLSKRSFPNTILGENKKEMKIMFQNHMLYQKLKVGQVFGMRSLLDPLISKKHILEHRKLFCGKLDLNLELLWEDLVKKQHETLEEPDYEKIKRYQANVRGTKACAKCFEADKPNCTCLIERLPRDQQDVAAQEWLVREEFIRKRNTTSSEDGRDSPFVQEFNDSHLHDISLSPRNNDLKVQQDSPINSKHMQQNPKNLSPSRHLSLDPKQAMREQRDRVREQIEKLTQKNEMGEQVTVQKRKKDHKSRLQHKVEEQFGDRLYPHLMKAQVSIIVTSATAKFLVVKKEDKSLLNEYLRVCMDRAILETNFEDLDRPERNHSDVQAREAIARGWTSTKERQMNQFLKESKMEKKANKLLDD